MPTIPVGQSNDHVAPDTLATPEGDNEDTPSKPLTPSDADLLRPRGDEPHSQEPLRGV